MHNKIKHQTMKKNQKNILKIPMKKLDDLCIHESLTNLRMLINGHKVGGHSQNAQLSLA
jgi:hypothetical protein